MSGLNDVPWTRLDISDDTTGKSDKISIGWSKYNIPYRQPYNALQTLDIHIPAARKSLSSPEAAPVMSEKPTAPSSAMNATSGIWVIFIHGGAWRDPMVTSRSALSAIRRVFSDQKYAAALPHVAGIASVNYSLSPHPNYPPGSIPSDAEDPSSVVGSRSAVHPQHILDVKAAITCLSTHFEVQKYILVGHSCGATLAFHTVMPQASRGAKDDNLDQSFQQPAAIAGIAGLYDLPALVHNPGEIHEPIAPIYRSFLLGAFGSDENIWAQLSPAHSTLAWPGGVAVLLSASQGDTLVPYTQLQSMQSRLTEHWAGHSLLVEDFAGDHNDAWQAGTGVADAIAKLIAVLVS